MKAPMSGMIAIVTAGLLAAGGALAHETWVTVGSGSHGAAGSTTVWSHGTDLEGHSEVLIVDRSGHARRFTCPPGHSIAVVQSAGSNAGAVSSSVVVGGGKASASTTIGGSGVSIVTGPSAGSQVTVLCR